MLNDILGEYPQRLAAMPVVDISLTVAAVVLVSFLAQWVLRQYRLSRLPLINSRGLFESAKKTTDEYLWNAEGLVRHGFTKSDQAFRVRTDDNEIVILSPKYANEIRSDERLNFEESLHREFLGRIPGFDIFAIHNSRDHIGFDTVRMKLTQSLGLVTDDLNEETRLVLQDQWTDNAEWHSLNLKTTILEVVARISSRVFLGTEVCRNPAWLRITIDYTVNIFMAVQALKKWPKILQPYVWRFVPEVTKVRAQKDEARRIIQPVVDKRIADNWAVSGDSSKKKTTYSDAVRWVHEIAKGRPYDAAIIQLGFSMAAIHTTTDLLTQVLYDLCKHPELIEPLREELVTVLKEVGLQRTSLYKLKLMDSVVKESQRLKPTSIVTMRRYTMEDVTLSDGLFIPKGVQVAVSSRLHWDPTVYPEPEKFDGYRFIKMAQDPEKEKLANLVTTSPEHMGFGHGKHACPGRFFASNEIKIVLAHILLKYEFKLSHGSDPKVFTMGWALSSNPGVDLLVRRRKEEVVL